MLNQILLGVIGLSLIAIVSLAIIFLIKLVTKKTKKWWLRGVLYILIVPVQWFVLVYPFGSLECSLNPSSPCGIGTIGLLLWVGAVLFFTGVTSLIIGFINSKKKK